MTIGRIPSVEGGIQPTIVDAKGDLIAGVAADSINRLAVGSNDQVLVADSSASTGLAWKSVATPFAAGKNKVINGAFDVWQRGTSITATNGAYTVDRFIQYYDGSGSTRTVSQQTFTPGAAPVSGYEGQFFARYATTVAGTSGTFHSFGTRIEDVRTFAGQTVTFSFWAKADATRTISPFMQQAFGSGGSGATTTYASSSVTLTTSWQRFAVNFTFPSVSGKTIGSGSSIYLALDLPSNTAMTLDFWGWQLEAGSVATPFQTATGTLQGELAACQRYYYRNTNPSYAYGYIAPWGSATSTTQVITNISVPAQMRTTPTSVDYANLAVTADDGTVIAITSATMGNGSLNVVPIKLAGTGFTQYRPYGPIGNNSTNAYIGFSAEL